jgi:tripartite ATP-independent transporter DctM subunit
MPLLVLGLVVLVLLNVPIAVALGAVSTVAILLTSGSSALLDVPLAMYDGARGFSLLAIPLFIFAGAIMNSGGISRRLVAFVSSLIGFVRGGLAMTSTGASLFFAEISGSAVADVAALGSILIPAMRRRGYPNAFAAAVMSSSATLAVIIPPSIPMILYGVMSGSSIVQLFVAGIVPGLIGGAGLMAVSYWFARRHDFPVEEAFRPAHVWRTFKDAALALIVPLIILGGIFGGLVTATEGAGLAVVAALAIALVYRELSLRELWRAMIDGGVQTAVVMLLVATSVLLGNYLTEQHVPQQIASSIAALTQNRYAVLALLNVLFLIAGLFLHSAAAIILIVPIVMPLVNQVGIDPIHFGMIVTLNLGIGQQTPPVASVLIAACAVAKADVWEVTRYNVWYVGVLLLVLLLVTYVPVTALGLVRLFYGS